MQVPSMLQGESLKRLLQGAAAGAVATTFVGFNWGGWLLSSTADKMATERVTTALVAVATPVCVDKFQHQPGVQAKWAELKALDSWRRDTYITDSGFATPDGSAAPNRDVASACALALSKILEAQIPPRAK
jgi:hypothetical protein